MGKVTAHRYLLKRQTIYENDMAQFVFLFSEHRSNVKSQKKCDMKKYLLFHVTFVTVLY